MQNSIIRECNQNIKEEGKENFTFYVPQLFQVIQKPFSKSFYENFFSNLRAITSTNHVNLFEHNFTFLPYANKGN